MKKIKKLSATLTALLLVGGTFGSMAACGPRTDDDIDKNKTQIYVANYNGGVGEKWLDEAALRFEEKFKDWKNGKKTGVQVKIRHDKSYDGITLPNSIQGDKYEIYFTQQVDYATYVSSGYVYDLTDLVTEMVNADDNKTILSKFSEDQVSALAVNGKYYAIPHYELYSGISYDAGVFKLKNLYFADTMDTDGTRKFVSNPSTKKSCGPNGVYEDGEGDDGLPSSIQEFNKLIDKMTTSSVTPFVWTGKSTHYTNQLIAAISANLEGGAGARANFTFDTAGEKVDIITGFNGDEPVIAQQAIDQDTGYLVKSQAGLYYGLSVAEKVFSSQKNYYVPGTSTTFSHLNAQETFVFSGLDGKQHIGMLIDGNYWYNEADDANIFKDLKDWYPETYTQKDLRFMPLPRQYKGTVTEGNGKSPVLVDSYNSYAIVNAGIDKDQYPLIKEFLSFLYSDAELLQFTKTTNGIVKGVNYDFSAAYNEVDSFAQSVLDLRTEAKAANAFVKSESAHPVYRNNVSKFTLNSNAEYWESMVGGTTRYVNLWSAVQKHVSAKAYFEGMGISEATWNSTFNK
ncbi:MAG: hypothetical protein IJ506_04340 [Clostridia bacterium]|nr:hypothetical protein [Clostridia bacterium]